MGLFLKWLPYVVYTTRGVVVHPPYIKDLQVLNI